MTDPTGTVPPHGTMTPSEFQAWLDAHPPLPTHPFEEPCGQAEGTDHCWYDGHPRAAHPRTDENPKGYVR